MTRSSAPVGSWTTASDDTAATLGARTPTGCREIWLLVPPFQVVRVSASRTPALKESNLIVTVLPGAWRQHVRRARTWPTQHPPAVRGTGARPAGRARRPRHSRRGADRLGQDTRIRYSARRADSAAGFTPCGTRSRSDTRARHAGRC